jgi:hypothetical protein
MGFLAMVDPQAYWIYWLFKSLKVVQFDDLGVPHASEICIYIYYIQTYHYDYYPLLILIYPRV